MQPLAAGPAPDRSSFESLHMTLRKRALRGAAVLTVGQVFSQGLAFARNIIVARLISPEDVGIAATLAITLSLVELLADVSIDKLLIQAKDGDDPRLQASCHAALAVRGVVQSVLLFLLAWPIARFFDLPDLVWAFQCVAIGPLVRGFANLDVTRVQRELKFVPSAVSELLPQVAAFAAIVPLAIWLGDWRAVLFATLMQASLYVVCTHTLASRGYRWAWDGAAFRRIAIFGWPLMINGGLLFAINQGDRIAIGASYAKEDLALWANAMLLASAPLLVLGKVAVSMALPILAKCRDDRATFDSRYELCMQGLAWVAAIVAVPLILGGGAIMGLIFGPHYAAAGAFVGILATAQAIRVCRIGPTVAALAHGETTNAALGNAARLAGVAVAMWLAFNASPLLHVGVAALGGEVLSFIVGAARLSQKGLLGMWQSLAPMVPAGLALGVSIAALKAGLVVDAWAVATAALGTLIAAAVLLVPFDRLRREPSLLLVSLRGARA
jgi:O-antigen/teichoic acid export membrane protein